MVATPDALVPWVQGVAKRDLGRLPREGKHAHEPPPEVLPRKCELKIKKTPSTGEGEPTETSLQGEHMLEVPARGGRRKPQA